MTNKIKMTLGLLLGCLLLTACSSDDKKSKVPPNGNVIFFHNIENAGELQLKAVNTSQRNSYGAVDFETATSMVYLAAQRWGVDLTDDKGTTATGDDLSFIKTNFSVKANGLRLVAFTGTYDGATAPADIAMHQLELGLDNELLDSNAANIQHINVSHLHKDVAAVDVYIVSDEEANADDKTLLNTRVAAVSNLAFGATSADLRLVNNTNKIYYVFVTESGNSANVLYESGSRELKDHIYQTLLVSPNYLDASAQAVSLFYITNTTDEHWNDIANRKAEVRVLNTYEAGLNVNAVGGATPEVVGTGLALDGVSAFALLDSDAITYFLTANNGADLSPQLPLYMMAGEQWTVVFYGDSTATPPVLRAMSAQEERSLVSNRAGVTISNAAYFKSTDTAKPFDVYILRSGESFNLAKPFASNLGSGASSFKRLAGGLTYQVILVEAGSKSISYSNMVLDLDNGVNYHFVITGNESLSFSICRIDDVSGSCVQN